MDDIEFDVYNMALRLSGGGGTSCSFGSSSFLIPSISLSLSFRLRRLQTLARIDREKKEKIKSYVKERDGAPPMGSRETGRSIEATVGLGPMDRDS